MAEELLEVTIIGRTVEADGIISLELVDAAGKPLPAFEAGAHVDVHVAPGLIRQYSLCNDPSERHRYRLGVLLEAESRGGSAGMHRFAIGDKVRISAPRNNFRLLEEAPRSILLAGGIGVTPLYAMAHRLQQLGRDFELHYCTRTRGRSAFLAELAAASFADRVHVHFDDGPAEQRFELDHVLARPTPGTHLYLCGPTGFMDFVTAGAKRLGWPDEQVHLEYFTASIDTAGDSFTVVAQRSGLTLTVPADKTIADVLYAAGVDVPTSCEQGICGTCLTPVLEGIPDHRDLFLTDAEKAANKELTVCCSRSKTAVLVLDI